MAIHAARPIRPPEKPSSHPSMWRWAVLLPVLIVSADASHRDRLASISSRFGLRTISSATVATAKYFIEHQQFTAVVYEPAGKEDLRASIKQLEGPAKDTPVILIEKLDRWESYLAGMTAGAFDCADYPPYPGELERMLCAALSQSSRKKTAQAL